VHFCIKTTIELHRWLRSASSLANGKMTAIKITGTTI